MVKKFLNNGFKLPEKVEIANTRLKKIMQEKVPAYMYRELLTACHGIGTKLPVLEVLQQLCRTGRRLAVRGTGNSV
jgi:hypothetical protein